MEDDNAVSFRRRRSGKKVRHKRRKRDEDSDSADDRKTVDEQQPAVTASGNPGEELTAELLPQRPLSASRRAAAHVYRKKETQRQGKAYPRSVGIEFSGTVPGFYTNDQTDYSARGISRLAAATVDAAPTGLDVPTSNDAIVLEESPDSGLERLGRLGVHDAEEEEEGVSHMQRVLDARSGLEASVEARSYVRPATSESLGAFLPLDLQDDPVKRLGAVAQSNSHDIGDAMSDDSNASEWELEQLRRSGHASKDIDQMKQMSDLTKARTVVHEEAENLGGCGESGISLMDTCSENVAARVFAMGTKVRSLESELESSQLIISGGAADLDSARTATHGATVKYNFYVSFERYVGDILEMLVETASLTTQLRNSQVSQLKKLASERLELTPELARRFFKSLGFDLADGYASPGVARNCQAITPGNSLGVAGNSTIDVVSEMDESARSADEGQASDGNARLTPDPNPLSSVLDEFKSLPCLIARFQEWKTQFGSDYEAAHGDLCLGKLAGALALANGLQIDCGWLDQLPAGACGPSCVKSRCAQWTALNLVATWEPQSLTSSRSHSLSLSRIMRSLRSIPAELRAAEDLFMQAVRLVLKWKLSVVQSSHACTAEDDTAAPTWAPAAAVKVVEGTAAIILGLGLGFDSIARKRFEDDFVDDWMCGIVCDYIEHAVQQGGNTEARESLDFMRWAVKSGFRVHEDVGGRNEFPSKHSGVWMRLSKFSDHVHHVLGLKRDSDM